MATRRSTETPDLKPETVAVLLAGWGADPPPGLPSGPDFFGRGFLELYDIGGIARMWREHESWLREQARLWNWEPMFTHNGTRMFYGERAAVTGED